MDSNKIIPVFIALLLTGVAAAAANLISARRKKKIADANFKKHTAYARQRLHLFAQAWAGSSEAYPPLKALQMLAEALFFPEYKTITHRDLHPEALPVYREEIRQRREEYPAAHNAGALDCLREVFPKIPAPVLNKTAYKIAAAGDAFMRLCAVDEQALMAAEKFSRSANEEEKQKLKAEFLALQAKAAGKAKEHYMKAAAAARKALLKLGKAAGQGAAPPTHNEPGDPGSTGVNRAAGFFNKYLQTLSREERKAVKKTLIPGLALHILSTPFRFAARAWGKVGFAFLDSGCLLFTLLAALPLAVLLCLLFAGMIIGPGLVYGAWSSGDIWGAVKWLLLWLVCLTGAPGVLDGVKSAYLNEPAGISPRRTRLRLVLIWAAVGIILAPVFVHFWPGLLGRGGAVVAQQQIAAASHGRPGNSSPAGEKAPPAAATAKNLLKNGDFEQVSGSRLVGWKIDFYGDTEDSVRFSVDQGGAFSGSRCVTIENLEPNDGKFVQHVKVKPKTIYKLSCKIKAYHVGKRGKGGNISALGISATSRHLKDTGGRWEEVTLYGRTGPNQKRLAVTARLGGYGAVSIGKVSFDDFRLEELSEPPQGVKIVRLHRYGSGFRPPPGTTPIGTFLYASLPLFLFLFMVVYYFLFAPQDKGLKTVEFKHTALSFFILLAGAFALRLLLAPLIEGYPYDISTFKNWAGMAAKRSMADFYSGRFGVDYPPGYAYILYLIGFLRKLFSLSADSRAFLVLLKMPAVIADILAAVVIYKFAAKPRGSALDGGKNGAGILAAAALALLYALNPAVILNSAVYGQIDSILTFFILLMLLLLYKGKLELASVCFVLALLVKPQALIFAPVLLYVFIVRRNLKVFLRSAVLMAVSFVLLALPFVIKQEPLWIFSLYKNTLASYPFATLNAFNLFALFGGNYVMETETFFIFSYKTWGIIFIAAAVVFSAFLFFRGRVNREDRSGIFFTALLIIASVFMLGWKMHERYLFPALCLSIMSYIHTRDRRLLLIFGGFTITHFINVAMLLDLVVRSGIDRFSRDNVFLFFLSFINLALFIYTVQTGVDLFWRRRSIKKNPL